MENKKVFRVAYDFAERWKPCPANNEEWRAAAVEMALIASQNGNDPFLNDFLIAVYSQFEREYKRKEEQKECV